jgi:hypothetical protein
MITINKINKLYINPLKIGKTVQKKIKFKALAKKVISKDNNINKILRLFIIKPQKPNINRIEV